MISENCCSFDEWLAHFRADKKAVGGHYINVSLNTLNQHQNNMYYYTEKRDEVIKTHDHVKMWIFRNEIYTVVECIQMIILLLKIYHNTALYQRTWPVNALQIQISWLHFCIPITILLYLDVVESSQIMRHPRIQGPLSYCLFYTQIYYIPACKPLKLEVNHFKFSTTWSSVPLPRPTTSSGWKLFVLIV